MGHSYTKIMHFQHLNLTKHPVYFFSPKSGNSTPNFRCWESFPLPLPFSWVPKHARVEDAEKSYMGWPVGLSKVLEHGWISLCSGAVTGQRSPMWMKERPNQIPSKSSASTVPGLISNAMALFSQHSCLNNTPLASFLPAVLTHLSPYLLPP